MKKLKELVTICNLCGKYIVEGDKYFDVHGWHFCPKCIKEFKLPRRKRK